MQCDAIHCISKIETILIFNVFRPNGISELAGSGPILKNQI